MAGHVQDRWYKTETGPDGKPRRVKTDRYGTGMRYRARYVGPDGTEKSQSFPDRKKREADAWLVKIAADMESGRYVDPRSGRVTFRQYAEQWMAAQTTDKKTQANIASQMRRHVIPYLGPRSMAAFTPTHIREWLTELEKVLPASSYRRIIFGNVSGIFAAAMDDGLRTSNPCRAKSVKAPSPAPARVKPWTPERTFAMRAALPERYRAMIDVGGGCGLRQGEIFGLPVDEIALDAGWLHVGVQVKMVPGVGQVFAPPKRGKERDVPLSDSVAAALKLHMAVFPPVDVTLPWERAGGALITKRLLFTRSCGDALWRSDFNGYVWKPALAAAGVIPSREKGKRYAAAREHGMHALRHFYASVLLDAGENVKALSQYLGHSDPGLTLRVYAHLMPSSEGRARSAMDRLYRKVAGS
ncbi:tyrosine-type recombinase/integrase [Phaeacidiphilus oryzae]|uniref:tyrosine-type recombinase/integrase n=1 Tax=Phaeacidiphilus oryzae TaxID=348818 RepID=UPI00055F7FAF|nr:site-specific integrase [Phaeacidiphilus oryzae]